MIKPINGISDTSIIRVFEGLSNDVYVLARGDVLCGGSSVITLQKRASNFSEDLVIDDDIIAFCDHSMNGATLLLFDDMPPSIRERYDFYMDLFNNIKHVYVTYMKEL